MLVHTCNVMQHSIISLICFHLIIGSLQEEALELDAFISVPLDNIWSEVASCFEILSNHNNVFLSSFNANGRHVNASAYDNQGFNFLHRLFISILDAILFKWKMPTVELS